MMPGELTLDCSFLQGVWIRFSPAMYDHHVMNVGSLVAQECSRRGRLVNAMRATPDVAGSLRG